MSNFKIGEKVVYVGGFINDKGIVIEPKINEIVEVYDFSHNVKGNLYIKGYRISKHLKPQSFQTKNFRKLDYEFAENLLKEISESVNKKHLQN